VWKQLGRLLGLADQPSPADTEYDPVYGLPLRAVDEWLARNPRLREQSAARLPLLKPADILAPTKTSFAKEKAGVP
jgi:hypothetical protein